MAEIKELLGKVITKVLVDKEENRITFTCDNGDEYVMYHSQDCCESVWIEDITGDLADLENSTITEAEEVTNDNEQETDGIGMWTFYKLGTVKGCVTIRWYGSSNGYYSVNVSFIDSKTDALW